LTNPSPNVDFRRIGKRPPASQRRGKPVILIVEAGRLHRAGHSFFRSENGFWLTDTVPPEYLQFPIDLLK
jgi:RNA:NAD 2'-phosphotransferase (TPT1/KptA family)